MKITRYRTRFANGGLKKELDILEDSVGLYMLVAEYKEISHEESRIFRLLGAEDIIKDYKQIIRYTKKQIKNTDNINELLNYKCILEQLERELEKKINKSAGGYKADKTKKEPVVKVSDWIELDIHGFSVNSMYDVKFGKTVRSDAYNKWLYFFPVNKVPKYWDFIMDYDIDLHRPISIEMEFICKDCFDVDNLTKSFIDALFNTCWHLNDDNCVHETICRKIGTCEDYENGLIRFRIKQLEE